MRAARVICASGYTDQGWQSHLNTAGFEVLQLDYDQRLDQEGPKYNLQTGFLEQLRLLYKTIYLEPQLQLITNAGRNQVAQCTEKMCEYLVEQGSPEMLVTAIRGANLLTQLEALSAAGIQLVDPEANVSILELSTPILSAQVELGAGPFVTALAEESRIIIAGSYAPAAPLLAAAVSNYHWEWEDYDRLATVAVATHVLAHTQDCFPCVEISKDGNIVLTALGNNGWDVGETIQALKEQNPLTLSCADVDVDVSKLVLREDGFRRLCLEPIAGYPPTGTWSLRAAVVDGFLCSASFAVQGAGVTERMAHICERLQKLLEKVESTGTSSRVKTFLANDDSESALIQIEFRSPQRADCEQFAGEVSHFAVRRNSADCLCSDFPLRIQQATREYQVPLPPDAIKVSVDTRPAQEWI